MEIKSIQIQNFKKISDIQLSLSDLTILVGINGSGKSSILQAIHFASCLARQAIAIRANNTATLNTIDLDYLLTNLYPQLGHRSAWGNQESTPSSKITINFSHDLNH